MENTIRQIHEILEQAPVEELPPFLEKFGVDSRKGVQNLVKQFQKKYNNWVIEVRRLDKMLEYERMYSDRQTVCGIDEAGRGPLAGPVVAAAVILPKELKITYLNDSKQLSEPMREELYQEIMEKAVGASVGMVDAQRIDEINILQATYEAMRQAIQNLPILPDILLNDAVIIPNIAVQQRAIIKGDAKSLSIAAASVIAKVTRDHIMLDYDKKYPEYGFASHKGYGSKAHMEAIRTYGVCPIHRRTFLKSLAKEINLEQ